MTWSLVATFLILMGALGAVWWGRGNEDVPAGDERRMRAVAETGAGAAGLPEEAAIDLVKRALAIRDPKKMVNFFRIGSVEPVEAVNFLRRMDELDGEIESFQWLGRLDANELRIEGVALNSRKGVAKRQRLALLTPDMKGKWRIDFDSFARVVEPSWKEVMEEASEGEGVLRVVVARGDDFSGRFDDPDKWVCYAMLSPDWEGKMFAYCARGSAQHSAMERIVSGGLVSDREKIFRRAVLKVRRNEAADTHQFEIERVLAEDWVRSSTPFDERF